VRPALTDNSRLPMTGMFFGRYKIIQNDKSAFPQPGRMHTIHHVLGFQQPQQFQPYLPYLRRPVRHQRSRPLACRHAVYGNSNNTCAGSVADRPQHSGAAVDGRGLEPATRLTQCGRRGDAAANARGASLPLILAARSPWPFLHLDFHCRVVIILQTGFRPLQGRASRRLLHVRQSRCLTISSWSSA